MHLQGKVAIVTGASRGIGQAAARLFAREGAKVALASRNEEDGKRTLDLILSEGGEAIFVRTDVSVNADVERLIAETVKRFGRLHILVNNAGVDINGTVLDTPEEDWDRIMAVNLKGPFLCSKHAVPHMLEAGGGSIIHTASVGGLVGFRNDMAYCASKGGLVELTRQMALDLAPYNIRVNCICPAFVDTPMYRRFLDQHEDPAKKHQEMVGLVPLGRLGTPEDIAYGILYLASDESTWVTGHALVIDGGLTAQ